MFWQYFTVWTWELHLSLSSLTFCVSLSHIHIICDGDSKSMVIPKKKKSLCSLSLFLEYQHSKTVANVIPFTHFIFCIVTQNNVALANYRQPMSKTLTKHFPIFQFGNAWISHITNGCRTALIFFLKCFCTADMLASCHNASVQLYRRVVAVKQHWTLESRCTRWRPVLTRKFWKIRDDDGRKDGQKIGKR